MRAVDRSSKASVTTSVADEFSELGRGRDLKSLSASPMRDLTRAGENCRTICDAIAGELAWAGTASRVAMPDSPVASDAVCSVFSGRGSVTERGRVSEAEAGPGD